MNEPEVILQMLGGPDRQQRTLAVVGLSDNPSRPSYRVSRYMQAQGHRILPVNPAIGSVLGERAYRSLSELPLRPDVVNVFRRPASLPGLVDEMLQLGLRGLWVQLGIRDDAAAKRAEEGGMRVVMDRCMLIEHARLYDESAAL